MSKQKAKLNVTLPPSDEDKDALTDAISRILDPEGMVAINLFLEYGFVMAGQSCINNENVAKQVIWFAELLAEMVGEDEFKRISEKMLPLR